MRITVGMKCRLYGFNLVELMIVLAIVGILLTMALPSFGSFITSMRMDGEINDVERLLNLARSESVKRGLPVAVCPGTAASTACVPGSSWSGGWIVTLNDTVSSPLQVVAPYAKNDTLTAIAQGSASYPTYTKMGYTFFQGTLTLHDPNSTPGMYRCLVFNAGSWVAQTGAQCP